MDCKPLYKRYLERELSRRVRLNPQYSLRSFAKALKVDVGNLSRCLNAKANVSLRTADLLAEGLNLSPADRAQFMKSLLEHKTGKPLDANASVNRTECAELEIDAFQSIADLHHYAILELTYIEGFSSDPAWIANELGISKLEANLAVKRLLALGLLKLEKSRLVKTVKPILRTTPGKTTSSALRLHQKQVLNKALDAIDNQSIEKRCNVSMTIPIDEANVEIARERITRFTEQLCQELSQGKKTKVYQLGVSFYSLQEK